MMFQIQPMRLWSIERTDSNGCGNGRGCGQSKERSKELIEDLSGMPDGMISFLELMRRLQLPERAKLDVCYVFHCVPASDGGMTAVYNELMLKAGNTNAVDISEHDRFIAYSSATLLCLALIKYGPETKVGCETGYDPTSARWYTNCVSGTMDMPPV